MTNSTTTQARLSKGRNNDIDGEQYDGPRPVTTAFDAVDLYCYLEANRSRDADIEEIISLFERRFHRLPVLAKQEIRLEATTPRIETDTETDENLIVDTLEDPVSVFTTKYIRHYTARGSTPPLGDSDTASVTTDETQSDNGRARPPTRTPDSEPASHGLTTPLLAEAATAGYRTGRALKYAASSAWGRVTGTETGTTSEPSDAVANTDE